MNEALIQHYLNDYKLNFDKVSQQEIYKWKAVKCFQDNWDINSTHFFEMLERALLKVGNLMDSGNYFPKRMLLNNTRINPEKIKILFTNLYNEDEDLYSRIKRFRSEIEQINKINFPGRHNYQDYRAIIVYLTLRYPERYFFFKFGMSYQLSNNIDLTHKPIKGRIENIGHFFNICKLIRHHLSSDQELLKLHKNRITDDCYYDDNLNILTQDFIYSIVHHLNPGKIDTVIPQIPNVTIVLSETLKCDVGQVNFTGQSVNFIQNEIENKHLGNLGELWVIQHEIEKLRSNNQQNLIKRIKHTSVDEGDGTGYDILSRNTDGTIMYIEVKTTKGGKNSPFYITRNELERSKIEKDNYYIYRLYNFNEKDKLSDLLIIQGDLTNLCEFPINFKVNLKD